MLGLLTIVSLLFCFQQKYDTYLPLLIFVVMSSWKHLNVLFNVQGFYLFSPSQSLCKSICDIQNKNDTIFYHKAMVTIFHILISITNDLWSCINAQLIFSLHNKFTKIFRWSSEDKRNMLLLIDQFYFNVLENLNWPLLFIIPFYRLSYSAPAVVIPRIQYLTTAGSTFRLDRYKSQFKI